MNVGQYTHYRLQHLQHFYRFLKKFAIPNTTIRETIDMKNTRRWNKKKNKIND